MSVKEPYIALGVAAVWGLYGWWYFARSSKIKGRAVLVAKQVNGDDLPVGELAEAGRGVSDNVGCASPGGGRPRGSRVFLPLKKRSELFFITVPAPRGEK